MRGIAVWVTSLVLVGWLLSTSPSRRARQRRMWGAYGVFAVSYVAGVILGRDGGPSAWFYTEGPNGPGYSAVAIAILVVGVFLTLALSLFVSEHRLVHAAVLAEPGPASWSSPALDRAIASLRHAGFEPASEQPADVAGLAVAVLSHPDGTVAELTQHRPSGAVQTEARTRLDDGTYVRSQDQRQGLPRTIHRFDATSPQELIAHHRALVARRVGAGAGVVPVPVDRALSESWEVIRADLEPLVRSPWRSAAIILSQFVPGLRRLSL